jgi:ABC-type transporter Mla MlaB component
MAEILVEASPRQGKLLKLKGELTIDSAARLRETLLDLLDTGEELEISLREVEEIDLACIQVLCAAHRSFHKAGRHIALGEGTSAGMLGALKDMGMDPSACDRPYGENCLWKTGGGHE